MAELLNRVRERAGSESGLSMSEVLVAALIIGIVAAIGTPGFVCQTSRADDAGTKAITRTAAAAMEAYANDNLGAYDGATGAILNSIEPSVPSSMEVTAYSNCSGPSGTCYVVNSPANARTGNRFKLTKKSDGKLESSCINEGIGGCPDGGKWSAE
jgi:type II secretory pathway pseudopilin PulG